MYCKKGVLRNFAKFPGKHLCQSLFFNKAAGLPFLTEHLWWLLLYEKQKSVILNYKAYKNFLKETLNLVWSWKPWHLKFCQENMRKHMWKYLINNWFFMIPLIGLQINHQNLVSLQTMLILFCLLFSLEFLFNLRKYFLWQ